jgi:hypothetical protein
MIDSIWFASDSLVLAFDLDWDWKFASEPRDLPLELDLLRGLIGRRSPERSALRLDGADRPGLLGQRPPQLSTLWLDGDIDSRRGATLRTRIRRGALLLCQDSSRKVAMRIELPDGTFRACSPARTRGSDFRPLFVDLTSERRHDRLHLVRLRLESLARLLLLPRANRHRKMQTFADLELFQPK